jgi:hypothetical protein
LEEKAMGSEKQNAANAANAKRSTGPKTAAGKARSSRNAYKHGIRAQKIFLLPGEDGWTKVAEDYFVHFRPLGAYQQGQVMEMVQSLITIDRCRRAEAALLASGSSGKKLIALELRSPMQPQDNTEPYPSSTATQTSSANETPAINAVEDAAQLFEVTKVGDMDRAELGILCDSFAQNSQMLELLRRYRTSAENSFHRARQALEWEQARETGLQISPPAAVGVGITTQGAAESRAGNLSEQSSAAADDHTDSLPFEEVA